jgi:hypothetical protein
MIDLAEGRQPQRGIEASEHAFWLEIPGNEGLGGSRHLVRVLPRDENLKSPVQLSFNSAPCPAAT